MGKVGFGWDNNMSRELKPFIRKVHARLRVGDIVTVGGTVAIGQVQELDGDEAVVAFDWFSTTGNSGRTTVNVPTEKLVLARVTHAKPVPVAALQAALWPSKLLEE